MSALRPSKLQWLRDTGCGLAAKLGAEYPETSDAAGRGKEIHEAIAKMLANPEHAIDAPVEAFAAFKWFQLTAGNVKAYAELKVALRRPGLDITGTADLVWVDADGVVNVVDWKTGKPENVVEPSGNLQLGCYGLAALDMFESSGLRVWLVFLDGSNATPYSHTYDWAGLARMEAEILAAAKVDLNEAKVGTHCMECYQRQVCPSWGTREQLALATTEEKTLKITNENAGRIALAIEAAEERLEFVKKALKAHHKAGGEIRSGDKVYAPSMVKGRESADLDAIRKAGATEFLKQGAPFERWSWRKAS